MTVTGKTLGENLEDLKKNGFYEKCDTYLNKTGLKRTDIIRSFDDPIGTNGAIAILRGNIAPDGAVVKHSAVPKEMHKGASEGAPVQLRGRCHPRHFNAPNSDGRRRHNPL